MVHLVNVSQVDGDVYQQRREFRLEQILKEQRIIDDKWLKESEKENCYSAAVKGSRATTEDKHFGTNRMS